MNIFMVVYGFLLNNYIVNIKQMVYNVKNGTKLEQWTLPRKKLNIFYVFRLHANA